MVTWLVNGMFDLKVSVLSPGLCLNVVCLLRLCFVRKRNVEKAAHSNLVYGWLSSELSEESCKLLAGNLLVGLASYSGEW